VLIDRLLLAPLEVEGRRSVFDWRQPVVGSRPTNGQPSGMTALHRAGDG